MLFHQKTDGGGFFHRVQILPLDILYEAYLLQGPLLRLHTDSGNGFQPGQPGGPEPALPGYDNIPLSLWRYHQRLHDAVAANAFRQFCQLFFIKGFPGLIRVGVYLIHGQGQHFALMLLGLHTFHKGIQPPTQSFFHLLCGHGMLLSRLCLLFFPLYQFPGQ